MSTQPTVKKMQDAIITIRNFAEQNDYNLCRDYQKNMVKACADMLDTIICARDWKPFDCNGEEL